MSHPNFTLFGMRGALALTAAGLALLASPSGASAQNNTRLLSDVSNAVPPLVMVLLDTSGSMEFERSTGTVPVCFNPGVDNFNPLSRVWARPRHVIAKEVFTGRFDGYYCERESRSLAPGFDDGYPIEHNVPKYTRQVRETGLLFLNRDLVRFGFMAFDSVPTSGDPFSYPNPPRLPETDLWNLGARGPAASHSPLIDFGDLSSPRVGVQRSEQLENAILNFIPFGSTPIAALFRDLNTFLATDPQVQNDIFRACRGRDVILVTDGQPTFDDCAPGEDDRNTARCAGYPYKTSLEELAELTVTHDVRVHVIGFDLAEADRKPCRGVNNIRDLPEDIECIHQLAMVGGTDSNDDPDDNTAAYIANNQVELTRELTKIINKIVDGTTARTKVATTRRTSTRNTNAGSYQFSSAFDLDPDFHLWRGRLERVESKCVNGALRVSDAINFGDALNTRDPNTRKVLTTLLDRNRLTQEISTGFIVENGRKEIRLNRAISTLDPLINATDRNATFEANVIEGVGFDQIVDLLDGSAPDRRPTSLADRRVLGDIFHSNPTIVGGPELSLNIPGYTRFANFVNPINNPRTTTVYVGSNDGTLHAFDAESDNGDELWSYLPIELQRRIYLQKATHIFGVDGSPVINDVRMFRGPGDQLPADVVDPVNNSQSRDNSGFNDVWDSVAVTGLRGGGRSYFALSVASPTTPRFLWELNPEVERRKLQVSNNDFFRSVSVDMSPSTPTIGLAYGEVALGVVVRASQNGDKFERGVAIVPGGLPANISTPGSVGKAIYVIDLNDGEIIRRFTTYNNDPNQPFRAAVTGAVAAHNDFPGKVLTRAFVGDASGRLLRVDLRSTNPADWTVKIFHDAFQGQDDTVRQPIFLRPAIATNAAGELVVLYGTGDIDDIESRKTGNAIFSLTERVRFVQNQFNVDAFLAVLNFKYTFSGAEKLTGSPLIFDSTAYFPTFVPNSTACSVGNGRVYGIDFNQTDENGNVLGRFDGGDDQFNPNNGGPNLRLNSGRAFFDLPAGTVIFGLEIAQKPACTPDVPDQLQNDNVGIQSFQAENLQQNLELVAQVGNNTNVGQLGPRSAINTLKFKLNRPPSAIFPLSWSSVLD